MGLLDNLRFGGAQRGSPAGTDVEQAVPDISSSKDNRDSPAVEVRAHTDAVDDNRVAFLDTFTPAEQKKIIRKIDRRILVMAGVIYLVKQIDVNNAASVKVLAVGQPTNIMVQLNMTSDQYNWVQSIYYISYIIFELPSNLLLKPMTPRPIMWLFGIFNLAGVLGSLLVYGIAYLDGKQGLSSWQWVFLIEGVATMAFAGLIWVIYPDYPKSPRTEKWLTPREQEFVELRLTVNAPKTQDASFFWAEAIETLKDLRMWSFMMAQVCMNTGGFGLTWFLPTIVTNLGFAGLPRNQLLMIPLAAAGIIALIVAAWLLKRAFLPQPILTLIIVALEIITLSIFLASRARGAIYTACVLGSMFSASFALGLQSGIGQLGGVVGPQIFRSKFAADGYRTSHAICVGALGGCFLFNCLSWYLTRNLEWDIHRIRRQRIKAEKEGRLFTEAEVKYFDERKRFTKGLKRSEVVDALKA
ncbi:major facilitator superfamily domain-containing protein [Aspergillus germanicus]